jgi:hypothetical protein
METPDSRSERHIFIGINMVRERAGLKGVVESRATHSEWLGKRLTTEGMPIWYRIPNGSPFGKQPLQKFEGIN